MRKNTWSWWLAFAPALTLGACAPAADEGASSHGQTVSEETLEALANEDDANIIYQNLEVPDEERIDATRIGPVRPGETLASLGPVLGDAPVRFEADHSARESAICVDADGSELYCVLIARAGQPAPDAVINAVVTRHPRFRTQAGVGPGVELTHAEEVYGDAVLSRDAGPNAVEYVDFDAGPPGSISFRPLPPRGYGPYAGVYAGADEDAIGLIETEDYAPGTLIGAVEVRRSRR